ncbi:MAG: hypothetical protein LBJ91_01120 [Clostridiales Family XIII bacterium]|jgi:hypothetical protein|nr:hypothetical protein [Clostridiales Family XIII bacterium]
MPKARLIPLCFKAANERERGEFDAQAAVLKESYGDVAEILAPVEVGEPLPEADAIVFPQLIGAAFHDSDLLAAYGLPMIALTSRFGTVEMWDWEIVAYLREKGMNVYSPYSVELAKVVIRSIATKKAMRGGAKFLMFQDSPGEGMQAYIFKRFFWWEEECTRRLEDTFGVRLVYRSYKELNERAAAVPDSLAREVGASWHVPTDPGLAEAAFLGAVKLYIAVKEVIDEIGGVEGVGANCLNESFNSKTTPCLAWNELFERDDIIFACEGDTLTMISTFILYRSLKQPMMMTNLYPFLVGMAALAHEKIDKFPDIDDPDNHALGVHCGYYGFAPQSFCSKWVMRPKALEIVDGNAHVIDCEFPPGPVTLAKIYPDLKRFSVIEAEIERYVQYPGSDCRNGALIRWKDGHRIMEHLCSHHSLIIAGSQKPALLQIAKTFGFELVSL